ncbi:hypothetical protein [Pengzhenrongella sp.]|jgi:hypothetical protein|uniref:hypothetical protein n=1 Tax=Pengzhenrongella sp. TaxID=2888820 RepID=UPI002F959418
MSPAPQQPTVPNRVSAGAPAGGQFATTTRTETGTTLPAQTPGNVLLDLADQAFPPLAETSSVTVISRVAAQRAARLVLAGLSDDEFFNRHWYGIESAAMQHQRFADDKDGSEAEAASPADTMGVNEREFFGADGPDRAGENGYAGYDYAGFAEAIAEEWRIELQERIGRAVTVNDQAATVAAAAPAETAA